MGFVGSCEKKSAEVVSQGEASVVMYESWASRNERGRCCRCYREVKWGKLVPLKMSVEGAFFQMSVLGCAERANEASILMIAGVGGQAVL
jgi:hypothetical protein